MLSTLVLSLALLAAASAVPMPSSCGRPAIQPNLNYRKGDERIVGGKEAKQNSFPWQVQIRNNGQHSCGGSILSNDWVLSAAHCFYGSNINGQAFRAGGHMRDYWENTEQNSAPQQLYMHEGYIPNNFHNDVALIRMRTPFTFNSYVSPICLTNSEPAHGVQAWLSGWGMTMGTSGDGRLKQAMLPIIARQNCQSYWGSQISSAMICAGYSSGSPASCMGDSGGPLVVVSGGTFYQVGIVSWGSQRCNEQNRPGVYASVAVLRNWITSRVKMVEREEAEAKAKLFKPRLGAAFSNTD